MLNIKSALLAAAAIGSTPAYAELYTLTVSGVVINDATPTAVGSSAVLVDTRGLFPSVKAGDAMSATFYYDKDALITYYATHPQTGFNFTAFTKASVNVAGQTFDLDYNGFYQFLNYGTSNYYGGPPAQTLDITYNIFPQTNELFAARANLTSIANRFFSPTGNILTEGSGDYAVEAPVRFNDQIASLSGFSQTNGTFLNIPFTAKILNVSPAVPEPATWAMMIAGFGFTGAAMRRRRHDLKKVAG